jgi:uncharacterized protein (DUF488 family)
MQIWTIGHSTHTLEEFYLLLKSNKIDVVVDVRSVPFSQYANWFNKDSLKGFLKSKKLYYLPMGEYLGARWNDKNLTFEDGRVDFNKVMETKKFQDGISRVLDGVKKGYNIALMCSEKEAFDCHRFVLISQFLRDKLEIFHIYPDKVVSNKELEDRLIKKYEKFLPKRDLFNLDINDEVRIKKAYELRNLDIAYKGEDV